VGLPFFSGLISVGALAGLTSVVMILMLGQSRVLFAMSRDHLLPPKLGAVHPKYGTPYKITLITGAFVAVLAGLVPLGTLAELVNIGTLFAFVLVSYAVIRLRKTRPELHRAFRVPLVPVIPWLSVAASIYLMLNLPAETWIRFVVWMVLGIIVYFTYGRRRSRFSERGAAERRAAGKQAGGER
jgi:basic amino acid/polyamine antiporter, APA family